MIRIVSALSGRLRLKGTTLSSPEFVEETRERFLALPGALAARSNLRAQSLILEYDPAILTPDALIAELAPLQPETACAWNSAAAPLRAQRKEINRYAKIGAMATLAVSMGALAVKQKTLHAVTGALFLLFLAPHMGIHRKKLLK